MLVMRQPARGYLRNADGSWNSEIKYTAFGEVRASSGLTPTEYRYTGQLEQAELGLYFYVARWYDPYLNQFVQPDTIIPDPANAANWNRYAYTNYNPINFIDPTGHMIMLDDNLFIREDRKTGGIVYINDVGEGKLFGNPAEQAAANAIETGNPNYLYAIPENTPGYVVGATFEEAGRKIGVDLGNFYTTFINLLMGAWMDIAGARYVPTKNNNIPGNLIDDVYPDEWGSYTSRGKSNGGREPITVSDKLAIQEVQSDPESGGLMGITMTDARWPASKGWVKMYKNVCGIEIHYVYNTQTGWVDDIKINSPAPSGGR